MAAATAQAAARISSALKRIRGDYGELRRAQTQTTDASRAFGRALTNSLGKAVSEGKSLSQVMRSLALDISRATLQRALSPLGQGGSLLSQFFGAAQGAVFHQGKVQPFARGGIVNRPTLFPMARGSGIMGEAGPEAVLPLARGNDGKLGVSAPTSRNIQIHVQIQTPDAESFRRSEAQTAALLRRAVMRGARNL